MIVAWFGRGGGASLAGDDRSRAALAAEPQGVSQTVPKELGVGAEHW